MSEQTVHAPARRRKPKYRRHLTRETLHEHIQVAESGCWNWVGHVDSLGYGIKSVGHRPRKAHRLVFEMFNGEGAAAGKCICHKCDNRRCVNPSHLFAGTHQDNSTDRKLKLRAARGERHGKHKLRAADIPFIRDQARRHVGHRRIAKQFGVCASAIRSVCTGRTWSHVKGETC